MSLPEIVAGFLYANLDWSIVQGGVAAIRSHRWGHLPYNEVKQTVGAHVLESYQLTQEVNPHWESRAEYPRLAADHLRMRIGERLRSNAYHQAVVETKMASLKRQDPNAVLAPNETASQRLTELTRAKAYLESEGRAYRVSQSQLAEHHPVSKSDAFFERLLGYGGAIQCQTYRHPVATGVLVAATLVALPLYWLYRNLRGFNRERTKAVPLSSARAPECMTVS